LLLSLPAPTALKKHGICTGRSVTSYPSFKGEMSEGGQYKYKDERVVVDGKKLINEITIIYFNH